MLVGGLLACGSRAPSERCRELGDGSLRSPAVEVQVGSTLHADGAITGGSTVTCEALAPATAHFVDASTVLASIPPALRPARVRVHHEPALPIGARPLAQPEFHRPSGALLVAAARAPDAIWLHELAHVRMAGARPSGQVARRVLDALEEGVADYYAATIGNSPVLASRRLDRPPRIFADDWAGLALPSFDPHRLGWSFAASLWAVEPRAGAVLEDLLACMSRTTESAADLRASAVLAAWLAFCPERSRAAIRAHVCSWLPAELATTCAGTGVTP